VRIHDTESTRACFARCRCTDAPAGRRLLARICRAFPRRGRPVARTARQVDRGCVEIDGRKIPGAVLLIARQGKVAYFESFGRRDGSTDVPMARDALFRIYSMTKPIASVAAMMLVEDGRLALDDPVARYIPEFASVSVGVEKPGQSGADATLERVPARRPVTVHDLLRHLGPDLWIFRRSL
jgi:CubicO group peptidase (beta-lactamase class C family)